MSVPARLASGENLGGQNRIERGAGDELPPAGTRQAGEADPSRSWCVDQVPNPFAFVAQGEADSEADSEAEMEMYVGGARRSWEAHAARLVKEQEAMAWMRVQVRGWGLHTAEVEIPGEDGQGQAITVPKDILIPGPPGETREETATTTTTTGTTTRSIATTEVRKAATTRRGHHHHHHHHHSDHHHYHHHHYHREGGCSDDSTTAASTPSPHAEELAHAAPAPPTHSASHFQPHDTNLHATPMHIARGESPARMQATAPPTVAWTEETAELEWEGFNSGWRNWWATAPTTPQGNKRRRTAEASSQATPPTVEETEEAVAPYEEEGCSPIRNPLS